MNKYPLVSRLKLTALLVVLGAFSLNANAQYYVVYPASTAPVYRDCGCPTRTTYVSHTKKHKKYKKHYTKRTTTHRYSSARVDVYYIWYAYPGMVPVPPPGVGCCCERYRDYWLLQSRYATSPVVYEHDDDATYYAPELDRSTADDVDYAY